MCPYLMRAAGFEAAFNQAHIIEALQYFIMGYGMFSMTTIRKNRHNQTVVEVSAHMANNGSFLCFGCSPNDGLIGAAYGVIEKVAGNAGLGFLGFGHQNNARSVLVDAMDQ